MSLEVLTKVRDGVERAFNKANYDHARFPDIAQAALLEAELSKNLRFDFDELSRWMMQPMNVQPPDGRRLFSDLPVTVARGNGFFVELLLWAHGTSSIHQHAFSGAFTVAQGASIHSRFEMQTLERVSEGLQIVKSRLEDAELLRAGDVRRIEPADKLTHSVFHLDEPTISIVVRTNHEPWHMPQLTLLPPHYAFAPDWLRRDGQVDHLNRLIRIMHRVSDPRLLEVAKARFAELDIARGIALLSDCIDIFVGPQLEAIIAHFKEVHGHLADPLPDVVKRYVYQGRVRALRQVTADEDERFALAVMMVSTTKGQARKVLAAHPRGETLVTGSQVPAMAKFWAELED